MAAERQRRRSGNRRLTDEQVREIREQIGFKSITQLAEEYGVGRSAIRDIKHGRSYRDVAA
jgi:transcriptional regulator with XRE-family HTH domain